MPDESEHVASEPATALDAAAFDQAIADAFAAHQAALKSVGELIVRMEEAPALIEDTDWQASIEESLQALDGAGVTLVEFPAPTDAISKPAVYFIRRAHRYVRQMGEETRAIVGDWQRAIAAGDVEAVQHPRARLHRIGVARQKTQRELKRAGTPAPAPAPAS